MLHINLGDTVSYSYHKSSWIPFASSEKNESEVFAQTKSFENLNKATGQTITKEDQISGMLGENLFKWLHDTECKDIQGAFTSRVVGLIRDLSKSMQMDPTRVTLSGPNVQHLNLSMLWQEKIEFTVKSPALKAADTNPVVVFKGDNSVEVRHEGTPISSNLGKLIGEKTPLPLLTQATGVNSNGGSDLNYLIGPSYFGWAASQGWSEAKINQGHEERVEALRKDLKQLGYAIEIPKPLNQTVVLTNSGRVVVTEKNKPAVYNLSAIVGASTSLPNLSKATGQQARGDSDLNFLIGLPYFTWAASVGWDKKAIVEGHKSRVEALQKDLEKTGVKINNVVDYDNLYQVNGKQAVVVSLCEGMGNQMFQAATAFALAKDRKMEFHAVQKKGIDHQKGIPEALRRLPFIDNNDLPPLPFINAWGKNVLGIDIAPGSFLIEGHLQSPQNFDHYRKEILELFGPSAETKARLETLYPQVKAEKTIAVHVRRGDYLKKDNLGRLYFHNLLDEWKYYDQALAQLGTDDAEVLIFSDDIKYCKEHPAFKNLKNVTFVDKTKSASDDMYLMSLCKNQVISNGTFAVWGAYLNQHEGRQIFCPDRWIGTAWDEAPVKDIVHRNWTVIKCEKR